MSEQLRRHLGDKTNWFCEHKIRRMNQPIADCLQCNITDLERQLKEANDRSKQWSDLYSETLSQLRMDHMPGTTKETDAPKLVRLLQQQLQAANERIELLATDHSKLIEEGEQEPVVILKQSELTQLRQENEKLKARFEADFEISNVDLIIERDRGMKNYDEDDASESGCFEREDYLGVVIIVSVILFIVMVLFVIGRIG